jgi:hypothetical protein
MKQRNKVFAGLSVAVAAVAIGGGAMVSASAMGSDSSTGPTNKLTMLSVGTDGKAVQCTFDGATAAAIIAATPAGIPTDDASKILANQVGSGDGTSGTIVGTAGLPGGTVPPGGLPGGSQVVTISATATGPDTATGQGPDTGSATLIGIGGSPADGKLPVLVSSDTARDGTPQECAAMADATSAVKP